MAESSNEYMRVYMLNRYHTRRTEAIEHLGGQCVRCGTTEQLEVDHITPADKTYDIGKVWSYSAEKFWTEIAKCQVLCVECHKTKTREDRGETPHGMHRYQRYGCRCNICVTTTREYHREYKRRRRASSSTGKQHAAFNREVLGSNPRGPT